MARTPVFPTRCNYWAQSINPLLNPPTQTNLPCELVSGTRHVVLYAHGVNSQVPEVWYELWFPLGTVGLQASTVAPGIQGGVCEVPAGSGRYYYLRHLEFRALDFGNEFVGGLVTRNQTTTNV